MSRTTLPAIDGIPLRLTVSSAPPDGVFFTVNAEFARCAAAPSASSKVRMSSASVTAAAPSVGRTASTRWPEPSTTGAWVSVASLPDASLMSPPLSSSASAGTPKPGFLSPERTV